MLVMFNVTTLTDFGYPETTHFIDPMEERYRSKPCKPNEFVDTTTWGNGEFSYQGVSDKVQWFVDLDAYKDVDKIELALEEYWGRTSLVHSPSATPTTLSKVASTTQDAAPAASTTCKGKGSGKC
jgi:bilirubin oxidase